MPDVTRNHMDSDVYGEAKRSPAVYLTRSDISWYTFNANAYQKPLALAKAFDLTLICPEGLRVPDEIASICRSQTVDCGDVSSHWTFWQCCRFMAGSRRIILEWNRVCRTMPLRSCVATGFDIPCLLLGWCAKLFLRCRWLVFCWDPPALSWRDRNDFIGCWVVSVVDWIFRRTVRFADRLVLNIHPQVLDEIGYKPAETQLLRMFNGYVPSSAHELEGRPSVDPWCLGVLSLATASKGFDLVMSAFIQLASSSPKLRLMWIGEIGHEVRAAAFERMARVGICPERLILKGKVAHQEALFRLQECGILLHPYLSEPSLKWNYPLKLVEYMSLGRAIVAADLPGVRAYITDGSNGLLFRAGDLNALTITLKKIAGDEKVQCRLACQAKRDAENMQWPKLNQALIEEIQEGWEHGTSQGSTF